MKPIQSRGRRDFMKFLLGSGALGSVGWMPQLSAASPNFSDYKALVCIFLNGGNDGFNMFVPTGSDVASGYDTYASIRGNLAIASNTLTHVDLNSAKLETGTGNPYFQDGLEERAYVKGVYDMSANGMDIGVNAVMPELSQLIGDNKASVIANIGTLVEPVTRSAILSGNPSLPLFLFAHNHQQRILQTGQANNLNDIGWAGKIADAWQGVNGGSALGLNISYGGNDRMLIGEATAPLNLGLGSPAPYRGMLAGEFGASDDRIAAFKALLGEENSSPTGNLHFDSTNTYSTGNPFETLYAKQSRKSLSVYTQLFQDWKNTEVNYTRTGSYGEPLFQLPTFSDLGFEKDLGGRLLEQLENVAKMIHLAANNKLDNKTFNRQIFFVTLGGFDTHASQVYEHPRLLRELSLGLWKFQQAMEEFGLAKQVTTFTMSDFGRTITNNGDGTDHAWGSHHIVMGGDGNGGAGSLNGGAMLGSLPDIRLAGDQDFSDQGRIIPELCQDQLNATLCRWFGMDEGSLAGIFPNLQNFESNPGIARSAYLNDLFHS